ncbi:MAG: hypothetical protein OHK93_006194 [Ramalina farinacea]|uniref:Steroid 5-alpha reductase C-terminal domain-containing protein n=1 Tax=Ramalina farinacea TaxID=258253 RepID=A0AA43TWJ1_9LECA|nr:hypothetical protein [Ramalina farinacea]
MFTTLYTLILPQYRPKGWTLWHFSARLTYNYWRKGGYQVGSEDYRWNVIKDYTGAPVFFLFNITLLFLVTTPAYIMLVASKGLGDTEALTDVVFSRTIGLVIFIAYLADNQQWYYYEARNQYRKTAKVPPGYHQEDLDRGFNTTGMFAWSRHPNFAAEQTVWVLVYAWGAYITRGLINWTVAGPLCYLLLFQGSTWLTELLSSKKYPDYAEYRKRVGRFLPKLPGGPPGDFSDLRKAKD